MSNTVTIAFRVKPEIKRRADALFSRLGMTTSAAMNILLMQTLEHRGFAAPVALPPRERTDEEEADETPNAETAATLQRVLDGTEPTYGPFSSVHEMLDFAETAEI
ncbi:MAG: type II toxin-antitoxin system RelB/DinJ family antitoxin [Kiritimatiellae bacterium]|nr:type II toxin-antitoxin system RelB/DinJ family antitoxin [Kiritimatiellia bacterium]